MPIAVTDYDGAVECVRKWAKEGERPYLVEAANTHVVALARRNTAFGECMRKFDLILPDGMPLVWVMKWLCGTQIGGRVYGPTFMLNCLAATAAAESHFLLGGSETLLNQLNKKLLEKFPAVKIAGTCAPPFGEWSEEVDAQIINQIRQSGAHFVWVGLGCPKQEFWVADHRAELPPAIYCTVGAAFAFHAGMVSQAPAWMQDRGLEWLYRLLSEPRRLWKRYLVYNTLFIYYLIRDHLLRLRQSSSTRSI